MSYFDIHLRDLKPCVAFVVYFRYADFAMYPSVHPYPLQGDIFCANQSYFLPLVTNCELSFGTRVTSYWKRRQSLEKP